MATLAPQHLLRLRLQCAHFRLKEFAYTSPGQTDLTVDFTPDGIMTLKRTELRGTGQHDPVQLTFSTPGFSNWADIEQLSTSPPSPEVDFAPGSIEGVALKTPASNGPAGVISLKLTDYQRPALNTVEFAQFRVSHTQPARLACHAVSLRMAAHPDPRSHQRPCPPARVHGATCTCIKRSP